MGQNQPVRAGVVAQQISTRQLMDAYLFYCFKIINLSIYLISTPVIV